MDLALFNQLMMAEGPMARWAGDPWAALAVMAGPTWRGPWTVPAPLRGPEPAKPIRVALVLDPAAPAAGVQSTLLPGGQPHSCLVWVGYDGQRACVNTTLER